MHFNVRSIVKNKHILEKLLHELDNFPDIIVISETRLNNHNINHASIQSYNLVFSNSSTNVGGVAIYVLSNLNYFRRHDLEFQSADSENVFIELNLNAHKKIIIGVICRHPSTSFCEFQDLLMQTIKKMIYEKQEYFLCGDFNEDLLKHESTKNIGKYLNALYSEGCNNVINKPTRIEKSTATLLDHMYTNLTNSITNRGILTFEISDHLPTFCTLAKKLYYTCDETMIRDLKKLNRDNFLDDINKLTLKTDSLISCDKDYCLDETMSQFLDGFSDIVNQHAPLRPQTIKEFKLSTKPWHSKGILKSIQTKNALFTKCFKKNDPVLIEKYKKYSNKLTTIKRIAKQNYYAKMIQSNKNDLSKQWKLINQILERNNKQKATVAKLINEKNEALINNVEICNELNSYFTEIGPRMASIIPDTKAMNTISSSLNSFFCEPCTESEVFEEIMHLSEKKSAGIENIPIKFIKMSAEYISPVLTSIYNKCMQIGVFPSKLKIAKVTPIYKNGCTYTASNYRPISVLSPFSKTFEKLIYHRLNHYFSNRNILTSEQFDFRAKRSTSHVITDVTNKLQNFCDNRNFTCLILLD